MQPRDARLVLREAREWASEGLIPPESLERIEARYAPDAAREDAEGGFASAALYAVGGALIGAALIALTMFLEVPDPVVPWWLLGLGLLAAGAGVLVSRTSHNEGFADALLVAGLVAATTSAFPDAPAVDVAGPVALLLALMLAWLRRDRRLIPAASAVAFYVAAPATSFNVLAASEVGAVLWAALAAGFFALTFGVGRIVEAPWRSEVLGIGAIGLTAATLGLLGTGAIELQFTGDAELVVGALNLALLGLGLQASERGLVVGAAAVLTVDAVVFAFDVGGLLLGLVVLVAAAVLMMWQAEFLRRYVREAT